MVKRELQNNFDMNQSTGFQFHVNPSKEELIELVREMVELTIVLVKLSEPVFSGRTGLNFFQVLFTTTSFSSVLSCEDLLISSLHRSANM